MTGWNLPPGCNDADIPGNRPGDDHHESCPLHDDADPVCTCGCPMEGHPEETCNEKTHICEGPVLDQDPDCICADLDGGEE